MGSYRILVKSSVAKDLQPVPKKDVARILRRIEALFREPRPTGCEKLSAQDRYRLRQGRYRIVYLIDDTAKTVTIFKVGHRKDVYRGS